MLLSRDQNPILIRCRATTKILVLLHVLTPMTAVMMVTGMMPGGKTARGKRKEGELLVRLEKVKLFPRIVGRLCLFYKPPGTASITSLGH